MEREEKERERESRGKEGRGAIERERERETERALNQNYPQSTAPLVLKGHFIIHITFAFGYKVAETQIR